MDTVDVLLLIAGMHSAIAVLLSGDARKASFVTFVTSVAVVLAALSTKGTP
jgi:hypothetical protein